jgi:sugar/nucleoside kinase (ribokinase family)
MGVVCVGSVALDSVKTPFGEVREALGGSAVYFAVAASYFTEVAVVAVVGTDFPEKHVHLLEGHGIDTSGLEIKDGKTFRWAGAYGYDLNDRDTIETRLNLFDDFRPRIPEHLTSSDYVFLANIDPALQLEVLEQVSRPALAACDTMNFWIEGKRADLLETMKRVDTIIMNDSEVRQLAGEPNLISASRRVLDLGPDMVVVKKGEHGAFLLSAEGYFSAPAYPLESVFDPTGAGDAFAGGFMGHLGRSKDLGGANIKRAIIYGTVMASFCVEEFSVAGMDRISPNDIERRYLALKDVSHFEP